MGDKRRFDLFAQVINYHFGGLKTAPIHDVAGGRGHLQASLRERGFRDVLTWEPKMRPIRSRVARFRSQCFDQSKAPKAALVVGMHPDEATDHIILHAVKHGIPFAVCPCCIKPSASAFWGQHKERQWVDHLERLAKGFEVQRLYLKMSGRNTVLIGRPR